MVMFLPGMELERKTQEGKENGRNRNCEGYVVYTA